MCLYQNATENITFGMQGGKWQTCKWSDRDWRSAIFIIRVWAWAGFINGFSRAFLLVSVFRESVTFHFPPHPDVWRIEMIRHSLRFWQKWRNLDIISEINLFGLSDKHTLPSVCWNRKQQLPLESVELLEINWSRSHSEGFWFGDVRFHEKSKRVKKLGIRLLEIGCPIPGINSRLVPPCSWRDTFLCVAFTPSLYNLVWFEWG